MHLHTTITHADLKIKIKLGKILFAGNRKLKIYGTLHCQSGKKMNKENRVFFISKQEAINHHYRPCGHCLKTEYKQWKMK